VKLPALNYRPDRFKSQEKNPSDVWYIQMVSGNYPERTPHPAQFPEELIERIIKVASNEGDIILDPFIGSGTIARVAKDLKRNYLGYEIEPEYIKICEDRLNQPLTRKRIKSKDIRDLYWYMENEQLSEHIKTNGRKSR
jgi:DNA modification methylase